MFKDRRDAGHRLGKKLLRHKGRRPVVLALPRGGVPVAFEVAAILAAPLDVVLVRRITAPGHPEVTVASVTDGTPPQTSVDAAALARVGLTPGLLEAELRHHVADIVRRRALYLDGGDHVDLAGRVAIVVDDAVHTGRTVRLAVAAARNAGAAEVVVAAPVAVADAADAMAAVADETAFLLTPAAPEAIAHSYADFRQVHDSEVVALLRRNRAR
jgi:putative phosphoribosyl transferase